MIAQVYVFYALVFASFVTERCAQINSPPDGLNISPNGVTINEGQTITATCTATGSQLSYIWFKDNSATPLQLGQILFLPSASSSDFGIYTCRVTNSYGSKNTSIIVNVQFAPKDFVKQKQFVRDLGSRITLSCDTTAFPPATSWNWTHNGERHSNEDKLLTIDRLLAKDVGKYTCLATNTVGTSAPIVFFISTEEPDTGGGVSHAGTELSTAQKIAIGSVVAIGVLVLVAIVVCFCCADKMPQCCRKEKKKVSPEPRPRRNRIYYEEPNDPRLRSLEVPRFYSQPVIYREEKPPVLPIEYGKDNVYISNTGIPNYYVTDVYTYDEMERRRRQRRKKKKSNKHRRRNDDEHKREYKNILEESTSNGDVSRTPTSMSRYYNHNDIIRTSPPDYEVVVGREFYREVD